MKPTALIPAVAVLALAACQPAETEAPPAQPTPPESTAPVPLEPPARDPRAITAERVGNLDGETAFTNEAIAAAFPNSDVRPEFLHEGATATPIITVTGPDDLVLEIQGENGGAISQVFVQGGDFTDPGGQRLLAEWADLGLTAADCAMGEGRFTGQPVCRKSDAPNIAYILSVPGWTRAELPDPTTLNGRARLAGWLWTRP